MLTTYNDPYALMNPSVIEEVIRTLQQAWHENRRSEDLIPLIERFQAMTFPEIHRFFQEMDNRYPILGACFLSALRRHQALFKGLAPTEPLSTSVERRANRKRETLLQSLNMIIAIFDERYWSNCKRSHPNQTAIARTIYRYEKTLIAKLDASRDSAKRVVDELLEELKKRPPEPNSADELVLHPIFSFKGVGHYISFQKRLISSGLGGRCFEEDDVEAVIEYIHSVFTSRVETEDEFIRSCQVRYFLHTSSMLRRDFRSDAEEDFASVSSERRQQLQDIFSWVQKEPSNVQMKNLIGHHLPMESNGDSNNFTTSKAKAIYQKNLRALSSLVHTEADENLAQIPIDELNSAYWKVGDLSKQNPYNITTGMKTNLSMFQSEKLQSLVKGTNKAPHAQVNREMFVYLTLSHGIPGGINFANALCDATFMHTLRVEKMKKIMTLKENRSISAEMPLNYIGKGTGHLRGVSFKPKCEYSSKDQEEVNKMEKGVSEMLHFINHYHNSYYPHHFLVQSLRAKKGLDTRSLPLTKSMNINRLNAIGKGLSHLLSSLNLASKSTDGLTSDRLDESLATRQILNIMPSSWRPENTEANTLHYQTLFVTSRLEELVEALVSMYYIFLQATIPQVYQVRIRPLMEKYATLLELEISIAYHVENNIQPIVDQKVVAAWLNEYLRELELKTDNRHPIYSTLKNEVERLELVNEENQLLQKLRNLQLLCAEIHGDDRTENWIENRTIDSIAEQKKKFFNQLNNGDFSAGKIIVSNLLSATLVQQYVDTVSED